MWLREEDGGLRSWLRFPEELDWELPELVLLPAGTALCRVQSRRHATPIHYGNDPQGDKRWHPPANASPLYGVMYVGMSPQAALVETLLHDAGDVVIGLAELTARVLWTFTTAADLPVIDLTGPALKRIRQDSKLLSTDDLRYPKSWSHALHQACPEAQGLCYPARPAPKYASLALFARSRATLSAAFNRNASVQPLIDWVDPQSGLNIIDWLKPFGVSVHDDGSLRQ